MCIGFTEKANGVEVFSPGNTVGVAGSPHTIAMFDMGDQHWSGLVLREDRATWIVPCRDDDELCRLEDSRFDAVKQIYVSIQVLTGRAQHEAREVRQVDECVLRLGEQAPVLSGAAVVLAAIQILDGIDTSVLDQEAIKEATTSLLMAIARRDDPL